MTTNIPGFKGGDQDDRRYKLAPGTVEGGNWLGKNANEKYFNLVKEDEPGKGTILVYNEEVGEDRLVGWKNPGDEVVTPYTVNNVKDLTAQIGDSIIHLDGTDILSGARSFEVDALADQQNTRVVTTAANNTVEQDLINGTNGSEKTDAAEAVATGNEILENNSETTLANRTEFTGVFNEAINGKIDARSGTRDSNFGRHKYPADLAETDQDMIQFDVLKYVPNKLKQATGSFASFEENRGVGEDLKDRKPIGTVFLPIPGGIRDDQTVDWGEGRMNPVEAAAANVALKFLTGQDAVGEVGKIGEQLKARQNEVGGGLAVALAQAAVGGAGGLLTRQTGAIMNPNMELLFKSPQLRPFQFAFQLTPRSKDEAKSIMKIIRLFKQAMAPIRSDSMLFLKSPHTFRIKYLAKGKDRHPYIGQIKECALLSCGVDYSPDQNYSTYEDGVMTAYQLSLQFKELEPVYNDDYGAGGDLPDNLDWDAGSTNIIENNSSATEDGEGITQEMVESINFYDESGNFIGDQ